jgi:deoxyribonuclease-1
MRIILLSSLLLFIFPTQADAPVQDYDHVAKQLFWNELYNYGGWTLFCGYRFKNNKETVKHRLVEIQHIYPSAAMLREAGCKSRMQCREESNQRFIRMEADMHNMYPVIQDILIPAREPLYGELEGEHWKFDDCDYERSGGMVEPRPVARGNVARALLYMQLKYGIKLDPQLILTLKRWNEADPPSKQEKLRNDRIEALQGQRNPYIDDTSLADHLEGVAR